MKEGKRTLEAWKSQAGWVWQVMWTTPEARGFSHSRSQGPYDTETIALRHGNAWIEAQITCESTEDHDDR